MRIKVIGTGPWAAVYRSLLPEPECQEPRLPDAVIVASKAHTHHSEAIRYLRWRVPVLVEKPFAMSVPECEEMIETAEKFGTYLAAAHVLKFDRRIEEFGRHVGRTNQWVGISWSDPCNGRYDKAVSIEHDVLPHIVSIIDTLCPNADIRCEGISHGGRGRDIRLRDGDVTFDCHLERDADARRRLIETDGASLDFSALPADHNPLRELILTFKRACQEPARKRPMEWRSPHEWWDENDHEWCVGGGYRPQIGDSGDYGTLSRWDLARPHLSTDLALRACRVTEDVLACVERFRPADRQPEEAWV